MKFSFIHSKRAGEIGPGPSQNRAVAIYAHGSSHDQFTDTGNILTFIRGCGKGNRFSIAQNLCQERPPRLPRLFSGWMSERMERYFLARIRRLRLNSSVKETVTESVGINSLP